MACPPLPPWLWLPVALVLLFLTIFGDEKRKKQPTSQRKPSAEERVERAVYRRQPGAIRAVWSQGRKIFSAEENG